MKEIFIAGIYNYCDRWCERCAFTSRCRNYEGESKLSPEQLDIKNKVFRDYIFNSFKIAPGYYAKWKKFNPNNGGRLSYLLNRLPYSSTAFSLPFCFAITFSEMWLDEGF